MQFNLKDAAIDSVIAVDKEAKVWVEDSIIIEIGTHTTEVVLIWDLNLEEDVLILAHFLVHILVIKLPVDNVKIQETNFGLKKSSRFGLVIRKTTALAPHLKKNIQEYKYVLILS